MILFHRFLDLTDELFSDVLPLVQKNGGEGVEKEKTKESQNVSCTSLYRRTISLPKSFYSFPLTYSSALLCQHQLSENSPGPTNLL